MKLNFAERHKNLWDWLGDNPGKYKDDWPGWQEINYPPEYFKHLCFACEAARLLSHEEKKCGFCPIPDVCLGKFGLLEDLWKKANWMGDHERASFFAKKIANLPWVGPKFFEIGGGKNEAKFCRTA